jgi:hypothetical protein
MQKDTATVAKYRELVIYIFVDCIQEQSLCHDENRSTSVCVRPCDSSCLPASAGIESQYSFLEDGIL